MTRILRKYSFTKIQQNHQFAKPKSNASRKPLPPHKSFIYCHARPGAAFLRDGESMNNKTDLSSNAVYVSTSALRRCAAPAAGRVNKMITDVTCINPDTLASTKYQLKDNNCQKSLSTNAVLFQFQFNVLY